MPFWGKRSSRVCWKIELLRFCRINKIRHADFRMKKKMLTKKPSAKTADENRQLAPDELVKLAKQMVEAKDPAEAARLKKEIVRGFYGGQSHA
jgi:hypothetical protein